MNEWSEGETGSQDPPPVHRGPWDPFLRGHSYIPFHSRHHVCVNCRAISLYHSPERMKWVRDEGGWDKGMRAVSSLSGTHPPISFICWVSLAYERSEVIRARDERPNPPCLLTASSLSHLSHPVKRGRWQDGQGRSDWGTRERWRNGKRQRKDEAVRSLVPSVTFSLPSSMPYPFTSFSIHSFHVIGGEGRHEGRAISCLSSTLLQMKEQGKDKEKSHSFPVLSPTLYLLETNEVSGEEERECERERKGSHVPEINRWRWEEISDMPSFSVSPVIHSGLLVVDGKERTEGGMRTGAKASF